MALPFNIEPSAQITRDLTYTSILRNITTTMNSIQDGIEHLGKTLRVLASALTYAKSIQIQMSLKHHVVEKIVLKIGDGFVLLKVLCEIIVCGSKKNYELSKKISIPKGHRFVVMTAYKSESNMLIINAQLEPGQQVERISPFMPIIEPKPGTDRHGDARNAARGHIKY